MRTQTLRHLSGEPGPLEHAKPPELSWRDYLIVVLQIGAEIEHVLMDQCLYAAYSLGGDQEPAGHRKKVQGWPVRPSPRPATRPPPPPRAAGTPGRCPRTPT